MKIMMYRVSEEKVQDIEVNTMEELFELALREGSCLILNPQEFDPRSETYVPGITIYDDYIE